MPKRIYLLLCYLLLVAAPVMAEDLLADREVRDFIDRVSREHGFDKAELSQLMSEARILPGVLKAMSRPAEKLPWHRYRKIFLTDTRVTGGARFWRDNVEILERASDTTGVLPEVIVAIIGVETLYGRHKGKIRVLDALATLGFRYPKRAKFFRSELEQFLLLTREQAVDPREPMGSYAGAMGMPQFISSSYREYAIDFDGDGKRDLWDNHADIIGSVGSYLQRHGWVAGATVAARVRATGNGHAGLVAAGIQPSISLQEMVAAGIHAGGVQADHCPCALIALELKAGSEFWAASKNFYVITRYNHSELYAMAVWQLANRIKQLYAGG